MVNNRNGSSYPAKPDGPGQGRGNTRTRLAKSSSRKTHLEDSRTSPHSPRFVTTNLVVNSEPEIIEGNILRAEPLPSGSHRNISAPIQKLVHRSKRRGVGNMPKPFAGGHELLLTNQELSGSGEDHRTLERVEPLVLQRQDQKYEELVEEPKSFICIPEEGIGNDYRFGRRPSGIYQLQKKKKGPKNHQGKGKGKEKWHRPSPQGYRIPKLEPSAMDSVFNMARTLMKFIAK
ncbi:hypothetical protein O181_034319 [Austropuccinia psidii MF-1]|uniref:Uncharacterized protein n=1 Tax=Austropuccinia psidii MF-1 TaxID=1389203 RepID=A0A9Q3H9E8_9BASI|nr:hypothetical protein [Austropuccinia psidii MF-1]